MDPAALSEIINEMDEKCWRCGGIALRAIYVPNVGAVVICDCCGHEHYFQGEIPNVPDHLP